MSSRHMLVLVIDDNEDDRLLYRRTLRSIFSEHVQLIEAQDGDGGLAALSDYTPDCVLLDYSLPGRNGIEVLKLLHERHPFIPVIMLTGQGNEKVAVAAMKHGAQNYISKSNISPETLRHIIHMGIEHCALQRRIHDQRTSLEVFTRALAHDLKEPARTVRSFVEMLNHYEELTPKGRLYLDHIQHASERMLMLIDTVFLYTRLDDPSQMSREHCDSGKILQEVKDNIAQLIKERGANVTCGMMPVINANPTQLMQLFQNLICNAITHAKDTVTIHIDVKELPDAWQFCVRDNGCGIEKEYQERIFEPFKRLSSGEHQGSGLGLAICKKIVESHGGKIWCESTPGDGTSFYFTLTDNEGHGNGVQSASSDNALMHDANSISTQQPLANILLVDDSRDDIEMTKFRLLERSHLMCNLSVALDGEAALATLYAAKQDNIPIDLMLLDINMPEMDGFELLERMRKDKSLQNTQVIMCTGSIYDKDMNRAKALGAIGYITKPIEFSKLKTILEQTSGLHLITENDSYLLMRAA